jgi:uncharacterized membrane protein
MNTSPTNRFFNMMAIVIAVAGLIWLGVTLFNMRQGGSFQWSGVGVFLIAIAALLIARGRSTRSR